MITTDQVRNETALSLWVSAEYYTEAATLLNGLPGFCNDPWSVGIDKEYKLAKGEVFVLHLADGRTIVERRAVWFTFAKGKRNKAWEFARQAAEYCRLTGF